MTRLMEQGRIGLLHDWSNDIKIMLHMGHLRYKKTLDLTINLLTDDNQTLLPQLDQDDLEVLKPKSADLKDYKDMLMKFKRMQFKMCKFADIHFGFNKGQFSWDSQFNYLLRLIYTTSSQRH